MASSLTITDVEAGYGSVRVLHGVSITVRDGELVVLLGSNGKSTLIKCITGIVSPSAGAITLDVDGIKIDLVGMAPQGIVELGIAMVPEGRRLFPALTAEKLDFMFETFPRLKKRRGQLAGNMSGGEQKMVAIARALMSKPQILLVDEPSVGLAPILDSQMIAKIKELKDQRAMTILMAKQNFNQTIKIADRGYVIVHGEIAFGGATAEELSNKEMIKEYYLGV